jgi:Circularly permutated YpsA SLOG family
VPIKIISGGQTGVDRAALDVAIKLGLPCGGFCPKGRKSEDGIIPERYPLTETRTDQYSERTELNVSNSDATLVIIHGEADHGTSFTISCCKLHFKSFLVVDLSQSNNSMDILSWISSNYIKILNVAGSRESFSKGIYDATCRFLLSVFSMPANQHIRHE